MVLFKEQNHVLGDKRHESRPEMRLYLDTNILVFLWGDRQSINRDVLGMIFDYSNTLYTSTTCVHELIHLFQIGKICWRKQDGKPFNAEDIFEGLDSMSIKILPISEKNLQEYASLPFIKDHRDPFDRLIIAQAISDKATLISSDLKFQ